MPVRKPISRRTPTELRDEITKLQEELDDIKNNKAYCHMCGKLKDKSNFYICADPRIQTGITSICRDCAGEIACPVDSKGKKKEATQESIKEALRYLDKPFIDKVWASARAEYNKPSKTTKPSLWSIYIRQLCSNPKYTTMRWKDSDIFKLDDSDQDSSSVSKTPSLSGGGMTQELYDKYLDNKREVIRQLGYDPFEDYVNEEDKPLLYSKLNNFIDEETKNDGMKMSAIVEIVKGYNQAEKINTRIDMLQSDVNSFVQNYSEIEKLTKMKNSLINSINALGKENGLSVNSRTNKSKGTNTLSGKIKKLDEIGFRAAKINTFDIETCEGMKQVAELSEKARHSQIGYDDNIAQEIKDIKVELVEELTKERDEAQEALRILLAENIDLKTFLSEKGLIDAQGQVIDNDQS